jgi:hypothetical protein
MDDDDDEESGIAIFRILDDRTGLRIFGFPKIQTVVQYRWYVWYPGTTWYLYPSIQSIHMLYIHELEVNTPNGLISYRGETTVLQHVLLPPHYPENKTKKYYCSTAMKF